MSAKSVDQTPAESKGVSVGFFATAVVIVVTMIISSYFILDKKITEQGENITDPETGLAVKLAQYNPKRSEDVIILLEGKVNEVKEITKQCADRLVALESDISDVHEKLKESQVMQTTSNKLLFCEEFENNRAEWNEGEERDEKTNVRLGGALILFNKLNVFNAEKYYRFCYPKNVSDIPTKYTIVVKCGWKLGDSTSKYGIVFSMEEGNKFLFATNKDGVAGAWRLSNDPQGAKRESCKILPFEKYSKNSKEYDVFILKIDGQGFIFSINNVVISQDTFGSGKVITRGVFIGPVDAGVVEVEFDSFNIYVSD